MKHILMIIDDEKKYSSKLAEYINNKKGFPFLVRSLETPGELYAADMDFVDILLVNRRLSEEVGGFIVNLPSPPEIIYLADENQFSSSQPSVFKYQNCDQLIRKLLLIISGIKGEDGIVGRNKEMKLWTFYTPLGRAGQTTMAITVGQLLSKRGKTLYLNLQPYSDVDFILGDGIKGDLSDLIYVLNTSGAELTSYIGALSGQIGGMDMMAPMGCGEELVNIEAREWIALLRGLENKTDYEFVVMELSDSIRAFGDCLKMSDMILTASLEDDVSRRRLRSFEKTLERIGGEEIKERFRIYSIGEEICKVAMRDVERLWQGEAGKIGRMLINE